MSSLLSLDLSPRAESATVRSAPKLRDSCDNCAASKLRCSKDKPTCARCAKRDMVCVYYASKRAGRAQASRPRARTGHGSSNNADDCAEVIRASSTTSRSSPAYTESLVAEASPVELGHANSQQPFSAQLEFADILASPLSFDLIDSVGNNFNSEAVAHRDFDYGALDGLLDPELLGSEATDNFALLEQASAGLTSTSDDPPQLANQEIIKAGSVSSNHLLATDSKDCCRVRAIFLLDQLSPNTFTACKASQGPKKDNHEDITMSIDNTPTIDAVISQNEQTVEAVQKMMDCSCSGHNYLLVLISLILLQVLDWYQAAACETSIALSSDNGLKSSTSIGRYCVDNQDRGRMTRQLVLSELHRVQRVVNLLSQRLKARRDGSAEPDQTSHGPGTAIGPGTVVGLEDCFTSVSPVVLGHLESELRTKLRAVSSKIVNMLRHG